MWTYRLDLFNDCIRAHHYPVDSIIRIGLDDRFLDAIAIRSTRSVKHRRAHLAQLKLDAQRDALLAREL